MMIGNTGAFLTGKLPYDAEVEYLTCTGSSYYQFDNEDISSGNNKDCEIGEDREQGLHLRRGDGYSPRIARRDKCDARP